MKFLKTLSTLAPALGLACFVGCNDATEETPPAAPITTDSGMTGATDSGMTGATDGGMTDPGMDAGMPDTTDGEMGMPDETMPPAGDATAPDLDMPGTPELETDPAAPSDTPAEPAETSTPDTTEPGL